MSALQNGSDMKTVRNRRISVSKVENPIRRKSTVKLRIKETAWAINRMAGGYRERVTADVCFPCEAGELPDFGKGKRHFTVDEVTENSIRLSVHCADP